MNASHKRRLWVVVAIAGIAVGFGAWLLRKPTVRVVSATRGEVVQTVVASGRVLTAGDVELSVLSAGRIVAVPVHEGQHVNAGDVLLALDDTDARMALEEARASVARSLVEVRRLRQKATPLAVASLRRAEVDVEHAQRELQRSQQLFGVGAQTAQLVQEAQQALALATTRRDAAQIELSNTLPAGSDRDLAVASMRQAQAALERARTRLDDCRLTAPAAATVAEIAVDAGDSVQPGKALIRLVVDGPVQLEMEPDERNLALLALGQAARASAEAFASQSFAARVSYIAPKVDPERGTIKVRLALSDPPSYLRADMTVSIEVEVGRAEAALTVPTPVVRELASKPWLLVVDAGRTARREVQLGVRGDEVVQVIDGVAADTLIVSDPDIGVGVAVRVADARE